MVSREDKKNTEAENEKRKLLEDHAAAIGEGIEIQASLAAQLLTKLHETDKELAELLEENRAVLKLCSLSLHISN